MTTEDLEADFKSWKERNFNKLIALAPSVEGWHGAASNFSHWCRRVYTREVILKEELE